MSKMWNNCDLIYDNNNLVDGLTGRQFAAFTRYCAALENMPKETVWYDRDSDLCFGPEQTFFVNSSDFSFFNTREEFIDSPYWGNSHIQEKFANYLGNDRSITSEYIIQNNGVFDKYKNKKILMIGGGPSSIDVDWDKMDFDYDCVWTCNNFYKNEKMADLPVDLISLGPTVDLNDPGLHEKISKDKIDCVFEGGISPFRSKEELTSFKAKYPNNVAYFHLRYFSKLGTIVRLTCLATFLGAKEIYIVGSDGFPIGKRHAFEGDDKKHSASHHSKESFDLHKRHYVLLWDYLLNIENNDTQYQNLGEGHDYNQMTDISKKEFPLIYTNREKNNV